MYAPPNQFIAKTVFAVLFHFTLPIVIEISCYRAMHTPPCKAGT